ncbi:MULTISPECIES: SLC26A/SulP transporter family protein [Thalassospira]|uniref:Sulfate permease n=2 Tax=Thalassospira TaxID=168934 RepID=A0A367W5Q4_9PROT|nr:MULTISPECIES: SulP family inorganic anion transporter [Thalassospira]MDG4721125.1 SulP family inorganic anion transporter [Thalassospira sp. FZY0004]RCK36775.1 hypothetical protein TH19_12725 [Thalassospira profundimaris]
MIKGIHNPAWKTTHFDVGAACVGMLATLPQAVAYGLIAFYPLGPQWASFGISASIGSAILFGLISGLFGANPFLVSGPRAVTALVLASAIQVAMSRGSTASDAILIAFVAVLGAGIFQLLAGLFRLGNAASYVPDPVLSGFVNASALLVLINTIPTALGSLNPDITAIGADSILYFAITVSLTTVAIQFIAARTIRFVPAAIIGLVGGTAVYYIGLEFLPLASAPLIGTIELSEIWRVPILIETPPAWGTLGPNIDIALASAVTIGLLSSFDTVISSRAIDTRTAQHNDVNAELRLHGLLNVTMGFIGFLPGSGTMSRSVAILDAGAKSRIANWASSVALALSLLIFAPLVAALPIWATAGMVIAIAIQAVDQPTCAKIWKLVTRKLPYPRVVIGDVLISLFVVTIAVLFDLATAVCVGVLVSVLLFVLGMSRNPVRRTYLGSRVHAHRQRKVALVQCLEQEGHRIAVIELQGALFFGSCSRLRSAVSNMLETGIDYLILDFRHVTSLDSTGSAALRAIHQQCVEAGKQLYLSYIPRERRLPARKQTTNAAPAPSSNKRSRTSPPRWMWLNLEANGVIKAIGKENFFAETDTALGHCEDLLLHRFGDKSVTGIRNVFANSLLLKGMTRDQITVLGRKAHRQRFKKGDIAFHQGDTCSRAYFLVYGHMDVVIDVPGAGRHKRVNTITEGTLFGEVALLDGAPRSATIIAASDALCLSIDANDFASLRQDRQDIVTRLLLNLNRIFASRLRQANVMISELER